MASTKEQTQFEKIEEVLIEEGCRIVTVYGAKPSAQANEVRKFLTANGEPLFVEIFEGGGVEVYVPAAITLNLSTTIEELRAYCGGSHVVQK
jgi:hypothetical protein